MRARRLRDGASVGPFSLTHGLLALGVVLWLALHLVSLTHYPVPTCDEGQYGSTAYQFMRHGNFGMPIINGLYGLDESVSLFGRFYLAALAGIFSLVGTGLFQARLLSLLGVVAAVLATYSTGRRLFDRRTGLMAAVLVALSWDVFARGFVVRPEIWLAASEVAVLGFFWRVRESPTFTRALLFGFVAALPMNIHPNGVLFLFGFGILALLSFGLRDRQPAMLVAAGVGAVAGGVLWLALHFLPDVAFAYGQWVSFGEHSPVGVNVGSLVRSQLSWLVANYALAYGGGAALQVVYFLVAIGVALWRRGRANVALLALVGISLGAFTLLKVSKQPATSVLWIPFLVILLAGNLISVSDTLTQRVDLPLVRGLSLAYLIVLPLLLAYAAGDVWLVWRFREVDYRAQVAAFQRAIPPQSQVVAESTWWYGLGLQDRTFLDDAYFQWLSRDHPDGLAEADLALEFETLELDYAILDDGFSCTTDFEGYDAYAAFVMDNCDLVAHVEMPSYTGPKDNGVYRCPY